MIVIRDSKKRRLFTTMVQIIKSSSSIVNMYLKKDNMSIQGMNDSQVCLFDIQIQNSWFSEYDIIEDKMIHIDSTILYNILSFGSVDTEELKITLEEDTISLDFIHPKYDKFFNIPLIDYEYSWMSIPENDYDSEFSISSKLINEICSQLIVFGDVLTICCSQENITLYSKDITKGEMKVVISINDLIDYSIIEDSTIEVRFSLNYIQKLCLNTNICSDIQFSLSKNMPLKITYLSQNEEYKLHFFVSPKIEDDD